VAEARGAYDKLLKNFPTSKYVPEAHLAFADYYFDAAQLPDATARYQQVLKFPKARAYWYAMYKLGAIATQEHRDRDALEFLFHVVRDTRGMPDQVAVNAAAKHDFVRAYARVGSPKGARAELVRADPVAADAMMADLAAAFIEQGKTLDVTDPACAPVEQVRELAAQLETDACRASALAEVAKRARAAHREGSFALAERLYALELATSPNDAAREFHAETLWALAEADPVPARWQLAADAFAELPDGATASANAWLGTEIAIDLAGIRTQKPRAIPARETALLAALAEADAGDDLARAELASAIILRRYKHYAESAPLLADAISHKGFAQHDLAANLQLEALIALERFDQMLELADALHAEGQHGAELEKNLKLVRSRSMRR
jgi:hypothetical protein